jgi:pheromone shutdown protein TraB
MMKKAKGKNSVLILGTGHEYQRHQDRVESSEVVRTKLDKRIRDIISERKIELIAEEAGDDRDVWAALKEQQRKDFELVGALLEGTEIIDQPVQTIAKIAADDYHLPHLDIRPSAASEMTVAERDVEMGKKIVGSLGSASRVLAIVGQDHQRGVAGVLSESGFDVDVEDFPDRAPISAGRLSTNDGNDLN